MVAATRHDRHAVADYARLRLFGIGGARDGVRWHLAEPRPGEYDFSSARPMVRAAHEADLTVAWDLCHYGWPDDLDIFRPAFVERFARFAAAFVQMHGEETGRAPILAPVNEPSFFAWAGGQIAMFHPAKRRRGDELKAQLVRAVIAAIEAAREVSPETRFLHTDPIIHVVGDPRSKRAQTRAEAYRLAQFQAWDMIAGRWKPELGGRPDYLDVVGVNYYPKNQWIVWKSQPGAKHPPHLEREHPLHRPLRELLAEVGARYGRPVLVTETGCEGDGRAEWLRHVCDEVYAARAAGAAIEGVCWYPILNHPGWTNHRHCHNGLWDYPDRRGGRDAFAPLSEEMQRQMARFADAR